MREVYIGAMFMATMVYLLYTIVLFLRRKDGERSRIIFGMILLLSVFNYSFRFVDSFDMEFESIISPLLLILATFMVLTYTIYPIEVISPGWLTIRRALMFYSPILILFCIYWITLLLGVEYHYYPSPIEMFPDICNFDVFFRLFMCLVVFSPLILIFYIPYTKRYNNTNKSWMRGYLLVSGINTLAYVLLFFFDSLFLRTSYFFVSVGCVSYLVYNELFVRLIKIENYSNDNKIEAIDDNINNQIRINSEDKSVELFRKLDEFVKKNNSWRDPDISMVSLTRSLKTNRTSLTEAIKCQGYENYAAYINQLRVKEFIDMVRKNNNIYSFQDMFFDVGFRSKTSALRNFKNITGAIPSDYFKNRN